MQVKIKKLHSDAVVPKYAKKGDAGLDLTAISKCQYEHYVEYDTGLAIEIPEGFVGLIFPRSSISNTSLILSNHVGVIDSGFRNSIKFRFKRINNGPEYYIGERIGQMIIIPYPKIEFEEVTELSTTDRGLEGFGSTGK